MPKTIRSPLRPGGVEFYSDESDTFIRQRLGGGAEEVYSVGQSTALKLYRQLREAVAPNERATLEAIRGLFVQLNGNPPALRLLGLSDRPGTFAEALGAIANWAREYREPSVEDEPGPEDLEDLEDALLEVLEGRLAGKWQLGVALHGDCEELAEAISSAINRRDDMWEKPLAPHELDALREAVRQAHVRLPSLVGTARGKLAVQVATAEAALGKLGTADDPGPEPRTLKCRHGRPIDVECEECEAEDEPNGPPAVKTSPAVKITKDLLDLKGRVAELERRATSNWNATRDTGSALCKRVEDLERTLEEARAVEPWPPSKEALQQLVGAEVIAATGPQFDRLRATQRQHETTIVAEVEKAVAPIRELVHEQLDKVLKAMEKTKDRVDGMLKAADLEPLKLLAVDHDDHEARLGAIEAKWEEVLGARWRAEVAEQLCAMAELDEMEDAEEQLRDRRVTTPPRPEKDAGAQEED